MKSPRPLTAATLCAIALSPALVACGDAETTSNSAEGGAAISVAASFFPVDQVVRTVGGDAVNVTQLVGPGEDAHDFEPTAKQLAELESVDALFYLGGGFQPALEAVLDSVPDGVEVVDVTSGITLLPASEGHDHSEEGEGHSEEGEEHSDEHGEFDPHVWLDPNNVVVMASTVADQLIALGADPTTIAANRDAFVAELGELDADYTAGLAACDTTVLVTSHDAFGYLASRYGLTVEPVAGISPSEEPSAQELEEIAAAAEEAGVTTVFFEENLPDDLARVVADEIGASIGVLDTLESLSAEQIDSGATYISVMRDNLTALKAGLGCA